MTVASIIQQCQSAGIELRAEGDKLKANGNPDVLAQLKPELQRHKAEILIYLSQQPANESTINPTPYSEAWTEAECSLFMSRFYLFTKRGVVSVRLDELCEQLVTRDRTGDDRAACAECSHWRGQGCQVYRTRPPVDVLHRCDAFVSTLIG